VWDPRHLVVNEGEVVVDLGWSSGKNYLYLLRRR
jgi:hypothetical protein